MFTSVPVMIHCVYEINTWKFGSGMNSPEKGRGGGCFRYHSVSHVHTSVGIPEVQERKKNADQNDQEGSKQAGHSQEPCGSRGFT